MGKLPGKLPGGFSYKWSGYDATKGEVRTIDFVAPREHLRESLYPTHSPTYTGLEDEEML